MHQCRHASSCRLTPNLAAQHVDSCPGACVKLYMVTELELHPQHSSLCFAGEPCIDAPHVQQCIWSGRNKPDARVPMYAPHYQSLLTSKTLKWQDDNNFNPYLSTSQVAHDSAVWPLSVPLLL